MKSLPGMNFTMEHNTDQITQLDAYDISAIIGYWRSGVNNATIADIINCTIPEIIYIIYEYKNSLKD